MSLNKNLIEKLRTRAEIRRQIKTRKSVVEGKPDRIADDLEEAANRLEITDEILDIYIKSMNSIEDYFEYRMESKKDQAYVNSILNKLCENLMEKF